MNTKLNTKRGSLFLEAAITLPVFILGILMLASIITIVARCENINYMLCDEISKLQVEALYLPPQSVSKDPIESRVKETGAMSDFGVSELSFRYSDSFSTDLISVSVYGTLSPRSILDWDQNVHFEERVMARAYTGTTRSIKPMPEDVFTQYEAYEPVYIFPSSGKKYHKRNCTYVNSYPSRMVLTDSIVLKYDGCRLCKGNEAELGQMVYCFEFGSAYHLRNCPTIKKYVVEIDKDDAVKRGYTPCLKCGG